MNTILSFKKEVSTLLEKCGENGRSVTLVVASKYFSKEQILKLYQMGQRDFGENRVQDALEKIRELPKDITWHFIGHLQKNKVGKIVDQFDLIHSVDSTLLAQKISDKSTKVQKVLLQINVSEESSKGGFFIDEFLKALPEIEKMKHIQVCGLMTIGAHVEDKGQIQKTFKRLADLRKELQRPEWKLSMGMSSDYPLAIREGADFLRIGRRFLEGL